MLKMENTLALLQVVSKLTEVSMKFLEIQAHSIIKLEKLLSQQKKRRARRLLGTRRVSGTQTAFVQKLYEMQEDTLKLNLRVGVTTFHKLLIYFNEKSGDQQFELMVFLFWLASGASYGVTVTCFNISIGTARSIIHKKLDEFLVLSTMCVNAPSREQFESIGAGFNKRAQCSIFSNAVGALESIHVKIKCPESSDHEDYVNRNEDYSIQMQAVCDSNGRFINVYIGEPGSDPDQLVLRKNPLYKLAKFPPQGYFLLGGLEYICTLSPIAIITPYIETGELDSTERLFNTVHSRARSVVRSAFANMKTRWRTLFNKDMELTNKHCIQTIGVCCALHNIILDNEIVDMEDTEVANNSDDEDDDIIIWPDSKEALLLRDSLSASLK